MNITMKLFYVVFFYNKEIWEMKIANISALSISLELQLFRLHRASENEKECAWIQAKLNFPPRTLIYI